MKKISVCILLLIVASVLVFAHDTWLLPRRGFVSPGEKITLDLTSGMTFPTLDTSIKIDRVDRAQMRLNAKTEEITDRASAPKSLTFHLQFEQPGIATLWVELKPRQLELTPAQVTEYFAEIEASQEVRNAWAITRPPKRWREIYVKHAKTFVRVGNSASDRSWAEPVGMSLELVPENDPTILHAGDTFSLRVLKDNAPLPKFSVSVIRAGNTHGQFRMTDSNGRATFQLTRRGKYLFRGTDLRQSSKPDSEWESDFTTMTVEVR